MRGRAFVGVLGAFAALACPGGRAAGVPVPAESDALARSSPASLRLEVPGTPESYAPGLAPWVPRRIVFRLDEPSSANVDLLAPFRDASIERLGPMRLFLAGRWGRKTSEPWWQLTWSANEAAPLEPEVDADAPDDPVELLTASLDERAPISGFPGAFGPTFATTGPSLESDGYGAFFLLPPTKPVVDWRCRRKPVTIVRYGAEQDQVELVRCDGTMAPEALDRLSILARPPEVPRPTGLLPEEPDPDAWKAAHEWVPGVRVAHPRLVWALQRIADAFPRRAIYVYSGYRPNAEVHDGTGHKSLHASGRALDIAVFRVPNEEVFKACRELKDVGCGFYPHNKFIHLDVRRAHSGKALWIDASKPGEPAEYVDSWPGVVDAGALSWSPSKSP